MWKWFPPPLQMIFSLLLIEMDVKSANYITDTEVMRKKAFTLIELVVVIAIIALLLSIALPGLRTAKVYSRRVMCRSNLRQLGIGTSLYLDNHSQTFFSREGETLWLSGMQESFDTIGTVILCPETKRHTDDSIQQAMDDGSNLRGSATRPWVWLTEEEAIVSANGNTEHLAVVTPPDEEPEPELREPIAGGYGYNGWLYSGKNPWRTDDNDAYFYDRLGHIKSAYQVPLFADCNWVGSYPQNDNRVEANIDYTQGEFEAGITEHAMGRFLIDRHGNMKVNMVFVDGHVAMPAMSELWTLQWHQGATANTDIVLPGN